jgi:hypothetical protein
MHDIAMEKRISKKLPIGVILNHSKRSQSQPTRQPSPKELVACLLNQECRKANDENDFDNFRQPNWHMTPLFFISGFFREAVSNSAE